MIKKATIKEIKTIHKLLHHYGSRGELLSRPLSELYDHLRDFSVFIDTVENKVVGCCALQFCWEDLAEIRSLAIDPEYVGKSIGTRLTQTIIAEAESYKIRKIFATTYRPDFFARFGFTEIDRSELPIKIFSDCILCVKYPDCDETAMLKILSSG